MNRILDQRDVHGPHTVDGIRDYWIMYLRVSRGGLTPTTDQRKVQAYVSDGRWVANCPGCNGGISCWRENAQGCCLDCGHVYTVTWHKDADAVEAVLLQRPDPMARHWHPHLGETLDHLIHESSPERMAHERARQAMIDGRAAGLTLIESAIEAGVPVLDAQGELVTTPPKKLPPQPRTFVTGEPQPLAPSPPPVPEIEP